MCPEKPLNLSEGARGDRILARLALFTWLSVPDGQPEIGLMPRLVAQCESLAQFPSR